MWTANEHASWRHPFSQNKTNLFQLLTKHDNVEFPPPGNRVRKVYLFLSKKNFLRAEKSKSLICWKRLKGRKRRKKAEKANLRGVQRPFGTFPKIHPFWKGEASLRQGINFYRYLTFLTHKIISHFYHAQHICVWCTIYLTLLTIKIGTTITTAPFLKDLSLAMSS